MRKITFFIVMLMAMLFSVQADAFQWNWTAEQTPQFKSKSGLVNTDNVRQPLWKFTGRELSNFRRFDGQSPVQAGRRAATKDDHGLITAPDEGVTKYYKRAGTAYYASNNSVYNEEQSGHVTIVEAEGGKVYIKDPVSHYAQGTWVEGTRDGNTITVAGAQPLAWNSTYSATLSLNWGNAQTTQTGKTYVRDEGGITFTVDDEAGTITLNGSSSDKIIAVFWDDDDTWSGWGDYGTVWTVDPNYQPASTDPIVLPDGAEVQQWYAGGTGTSAVPTDVKVAFVGNEVYISGLTSNFPDAWIKGTIDGTTVTFSKFQFVGMYNNTMPIWAVGADPETGALQDFTMTYDSEAKTLTLDANQLIVFNAAEDRMYYLGYIESLTIYAEEPAPAVIDELPYVNSFDDAASQKQFTIIDANEDGRTWSWYNGMARYTYHQTNQGDDWLISPQIYLQAGKTYIFNILAHAQSSTYPERIEVKVAKAPESDNNAPTAALMAAGNEVIAPSDVTTTGFVSFKNDAFTVAETGYYYIGVHAISNADSYYLYVDDFEVNLKEPEDIEISPESGADIATALATAEEGKNVKNITINLAEGGNYTISGPLTAYANFAINGNGATIDASGLDGNFIEWNKEPVVPQVESGQYVITDNILIQGVTVTGLKKAAVSDNGIAYAFVNFTIDNCVFQWDTQKNVGLNFAASMPINLNITNSTMYSTAPGTANFIAMSGKRPWQITGYEEETGKFTCSHNTFYNIAKAKQFMNTNTLKGQKYLYEFNSNIFVNVSNKKIYGNMTNNKNQLTTDGLNTYMWDGVFFAETNYNGDEGLQTDPGFKDAANGDFALASPSAQAKAEGGQTGDPRWGTWNAYSITFAEGIKYGNVKADKSYAAEGDVVTLTATGNPADKFEVESVKVEGVTSNQEVAVTPDAENPGVFTFTMPADAVVVSATFQRIAEDIIVNPEDITDGDITAAIDKKIAELAIVDEQTQEEIPGRVKNITINLAEGGEYKVAKAIKGPANVIINGNGATIDASGADANFIELQGSSVKAIKADGVTESDHYLIDIVAINDVTVKGLKKAIIRDTQKTLLKALTIENSVIEASNGKPAIDFDGKGYIEQVTVNRSTIWASTGTNKFFAKYGSRPKNLWSGDEAGPYTLQGFDVQNSTFVNIANSKNFCDISQKGTAQNVYTIKNNIFVNCGKSGQVVVGFNGGQTSATPVWDVDGNVFNYDGNDVSAAEVKKAGQKDDEDIVKNSLPCRVMFSAVETPDFGGILVLAPGTEAPETKPGDPRWTFEYKNSFAINIDTRFGDVTTVPAGYAAEGEVITITAKPNPADKFELESLKAEGVNTDLEIELTLVEGTTDQYTFTMPADDVNINATFRRIAVDIYVNPEDITDGDIAAALDAKIASFDYQDPKTEEIIPVRVNNIYITLAGGESYTLTKTLTAPNNILLQGAAEEGDELAVINVAEDVTDGVITLNGTEALAPKADGTDSDHRLIANVTIEGVAIYDLQGAVVKDAQKTLVENLTISNAIIQMPDAQKNVIDFNGKGYVGKLTVLNSTIYAEQKNTGFFAQYGSRPKNVNGDLLQEFDVENCTFANIANGKNFCDLKQNGTAQNVYTIKNSIFTDCGKSGQVVVGFNKGQTSATPVWDVDGNIFNWQGNDSSAAEVAKAGQKDGEDIVKNSPACRVLFSDVEKPDFGGIIVLAPGTEAPETLPGDPRWLLSTQEGHSITVVVNNEEFGTATTQYPYAIEGEEVGLDIKPVEGYEVEVAILTHVNGLLIEVLDKDADSFTMYGEDIIVYIEFKKSTTGIDTVESGADFLEGDWFTVNGVRIDRPTTKGLYIHNGKKVVLK